MESEHFQGNRLSNSSNGGRSALFQGDSSEEYDAEAVGGVGFFLEVHGRITLQSPLPGASQTSKNLVFPDKKPLLLYVKTIEHLYFPWF